MVTPQEITTYWMDEVGPKGWYSGGAELDAQVRARFEATWHEAQEGACGFWLTSAEGTLGYLILMDQLPRNMFRGSAQSFASDASARAAADGAIERDWDLSVDGPLRQFFYMPFMHSEDMADQDRCVALMATRLVDSPDSLRHARAHREIICLFSRFPYRNDAFGRETTPAEKDWMENGGYGDALNVVDAEYGAPD